MVAQVNECDRQRLELLLYDQLCEAELDAVTRHLESCQSCRQYLEQSAGEERWWNEASEFLRRAADDAAVGGVSASTGRESSAQLLSTDELGPVEFSLDFLEPSDNPAMIGRLDDYEILELIGRGGMGVVLKGYQRELNRYVAIKVMAPHYAASGAARKRFAREAQAAAAVVHPHVVAIHSVDAKGKLPYLVMPYVKARSLQARINEEGPLELTEILRTGKQAAEGLAAAHTQGLVHRDVKPANILLEDDVGRVLLTDFGLARAVDDATMTRSGVIAGTPQYMSPEQAHGEPIDARSDLFSLGSVMYAMCTGRPPFRAETTMGILRRICEETPRPIREINPDIPAWLAAIVEKLHAKSPAERFQSAAEVAKLLGRCLAHVQQPTAVPLPAAAAAAACSALITHDSRPMAPAGSKSSLNIVDWIERMVLCALSTRRRRVLAAIAALAATIAIPVVGFYFFQRLPHRDAAASAAATPERQPNAPPATTPSSAATAAQDNPPESDGPPPLPFWFDEIDVRLRQLEQVTSALEHDVRQAWPVAPGDLETNPTETPGKSSAGQDTGQANQLKLPNPEAQEHAP